jgi:hypothetical protein
MRVIRPPERKVLPPLARPRYSGGDRPKQHGAGRWDQPPLPADRDHRGDLLWSGRGIRAAEIDRGGICGRRRSTQAHPWAAEVDAGAFVGGGDRHRRICRRLRSTGAASMADGGRHRRICGRRRSTRAHSWAAGIDTGGVCGRRRSTQAHSWAAEIDTGAFVGGGDRHGRLKPRAGTMGSLADCARLRHRASERAARDPSGVAE